MIAHAHFYVIQNHVQQCNVCTCHEIAGCVCRLVRWDMRAPEGVVQEMSSPSIVQWAGGHDYKTNVAFNCMATSGKHSLAVAVA